MKLLRLYIKDFWCYDHAYIDLTQFSSALIVGKKENNDTISNGVGKTTIFKAIEYCLFNHSDITLDNIIRDEQELCSITIDFIVDNQEYRLTRTRTKKGITDLTLYLRNAVIGDENQVLHLIKNDKQSPIHSDVYWDDISGRRTQDTEKELNKLIKINIKSFRIFVHFMQDDISGLTTSTPEKRKAILRDALNLTIYAKLEKIAKDKLTLFTREADKYKTMLEMLGNPDATILDFSTKLAKAEQDLNIQQANLSEIEVSKKQLTETINQLTNQHSILESNFSSLLQQEQSLLNEKKIMENSVKEYSTKKNNIFNLAKEITAEIRTLDENQTHLSAIDFSQITSLSEQFVSLKEKNAQLNLTIQNDMARCEKLKKPIPVDGECENCRQPISKEHRALCQQTLTQELKEKQANILNCKKEIANLNSSSVILQQEINKLTLARQQLENIKTKLINKKQESKDKREIYEEYKNNLDKSNADLANKTEQLNQVSEQLNSSARNEAKELQKQITNEKNNLTILNNQIFTFNKEIAHLNNVKAIFQHDIEKKQEEKKKKETAIKLLSDFEDKIIMYPSVIQAFSNQGVPNLIIQNVLDDLQIEANNLLNQLKPGIQLSFIIEKQKTDGTDGDTLDIHYSVNGKRRYHEQLSGAQRLAASFSMKLGLSILLQKMSGVDIKFLLLDEIDQSLDKSSTDALAEIVKYFQKDYTILVITHDDQLKGKFTNEVLVEQSADMVSTAKVVSSW
jgi:DNA repair exonuclease SbcCD ATPase subunit